MYLLDGTGLSFDDRSIQAGGRYEAEIKEVRAAEILTASGLPQDDSLAGSVGIVRFGDGTTRAVMVKSVVAQQAPGRGSRVVLVEEPGFSFAPAKPSATHLYFPHRTMPGECVLTLYSSAYCTAQ